MNKISFKGPYTFLKHKGLSSIFESDIKNKHGIYIWTVPLKDKEFIYYIGMTASQTFSKRLTQHLKGYLSGEYGINDPTELQKGKRIRIWDGLWRGANIEDFIKRHMGLYPKILALIKAYRVYVIPLDYEKRLIERIEAALALYLRHQPGVIRDIQEPEIRYKEREKTEKPIIVSLEYNSKIMGLPQTLEV